MASFILFLFTTLFIPDVNHKSIQDLASDFNYGVVVDCGSSGSRAHIFRWKQEPIVNYIELVRDSSNGTPLNKHITPGLSTLKDNPDRASDYMEPIMNFISESIPRDKHLNTPVYFMATAGLRLLDDSTQRKILNDITRDIRAKFDFPRIKSQVISGAYEGIYSWLSLNVKEKLNDTSHNTRSFGMIEMGGASAQVTYELDPAVENDILKELTSTESIAAFKNEQVTLNLGQGKSVKLFATTFLGLGVNNAREAAVDLLVEDYVKGTGGVRSERSESNMYLKDPCLTVGSSELMPRPIELLQNANLSIGSVVKQQSFTVHLEGIGNFLNCIDLLERVLHIVKNRRLNCSPSKKTCSLALLGTNFIPYKHYPFIGLSEMFFTTNEMINSAGPFNRPKVLHETQRICSTQYNRLLEMYSDSGLSYEDRILYECFKASWILVMLHGSGFNMPVDYDNFRTVNQLNGEEIDWTVGAIISELGLSSVNSPKN